MVNGFSLVVDMETLDNDSVTRVVVDFADSKQRHLQTLYFGNGCYEECRVIGHTVESIYVFVRFLQSGGYELCKSCESRQSRLYRDGDGCFPSVEPFVFISPITRDGSRIDFENLEAGIQAFAASLADSSVSNQPEPSQRPWWRFW